MRLRRIWAHLAALTVISILIVLSLSPSLSAATAEPAVLGRAWYWQDYQQQEVNGPNGTIVVETTNPFCPTVPGSLGGVPKTCADGRLPVEIRAGDYDSQNKFSAVAFDFALVPIGSDIDSFRVTFLEAKSGCYDRKGKQGDPQSDCQTEQTTQFNAEDKVLQACLLGAFFGDGEGRPAKEAPKYRCSDSDPTATRKAVKSKDPSKTGENADHTWTFDLTAFAQSWADNPPEMTGVVIRARAPKANTQPSDSNWRVVMFGPKFPNGIVSQLKYTPAAPLLGGGGGGFDGGGSGGSGTFIPGSPGTPGTPAVPGTPGTPAVPGTEGTSTTEPVDANADSSSSPISATDQKNEPITTPGYVWLGILAGLVGLSMVRSLVIEKATGIRPDGVLAQIKALNPGDGTTAAVTTGPWTAIGAGLSTVSGWFHSAGSAIGNKLPFGKKG